MLRPRRSSERAQEKNTTARTATVGSSPKDQAMLPAAFWSASGSIPHDAGAASAVLNATQQVGASIGTALLATLSVGTATDAVTAAVVAGRDPRDPAVGLSAQVEGYTTAFTWAAALLLVGAVVAGVLIKATKDDLPTDNAMIHAG